MLPKRFKIEPTTHVSLPKIGNYAISNFPENIVQEFGMLDKIKEELAAAYYQVELLSLASSAKTQLLTKMVEDHLKEISVPANSNEQ